MAEYDQKESPRPGYGIRGTSFYWYEKKEMPEEEKMRIRGLVKGEPVGTFDIGGETHQLLKVDGAAFKNIFIENQIYLYKGDYTAPSEENDYPDSDNYVSDDGLAGFSISETGWLVSLYSNYAVGGFAKAIRPYVVSKAYKLVCIVADTDERNGLVELYRDLYGFRKYASTINDIEVMREHYGDEFIDTFVSRNGVPFHIFMIGANAEGCGGEIRRFHDYFEAEAYVEKTVFQRQAGER